MSYRKLFISQLLQSERQADGQHKFASMVFDKVWLQGVAIEVDDENVVLDDSTGLLRVGTKRLLESHPLRAPLQPGKYLMLIGAYKNNSFVVHKLVDLETQPDREAMWFMEVIDLSRKFYFQT
eukprot:TRINITY_DN2570_c0_g1_i1.p1 TRINITY_DN2570_c0_g1~~TRINITY_DN2570_c0_g1_i1.p1  ORF type:complete len:123 (+),score=24.28 TRINITY_DN2570_c0_g1_i1:60-428(+)